MLYNVPCAGDSVPPTTPSLPSGPAVSDGPPILPAHIEDTIKAIAALHAEHRRGATPAERMMHRLTTIVAKPRFLAALSAAVLCWVFGNVLVLKLGGHPIDDPPFFWMQTAVTVSSLYLTAIILMTQRREDQLSNLREQLTLELAILSEQKTAKTIELLEELRRDSPNIRDRFDAEADAMARPANPQSVLEAIKDTEAEAELLETSPNAPTTDSRDPE
jgi:uncharacterized membrane protein